MLKSRIILLVISALVVVGLFLLPRVVVENDQEISSVTADSAGVSPEIHVPVPRALEDQIRNLRAAFSGDSRNEKNAIFADSLAKLYADAGKFDSAAWFAERAAEFFNTEESWTRAADSYYQAYGFAVDAQKQATYAAKARTYFDKVLRGNPGNLEAKTKLAMTYLSDANPMQAITTLREVLAVDPDNKLALYNMGMLSIQSGQYDRAVERLERLTELDPENTQAHLLLGIAYMNTGKRQKARAQFDKVKLLDSDPAVQAAADSYLKDLK